MIRTAETTKTVKLISSPAVCWVRDADCTFIINDETRQVIRLMGAAAVVWDWLNLGYSFEKTARMLALVQAVPVPQAEQHLLTFLADWRASGLLDAEAETQHG